MKYFGTDGIRGVYGDGITEDIAYRTGRALAALFGGRGVVGRDTRTSGPSLESALTSGIADGGSDVETLGVLPTPAVSGLTRSSGATFGVMLSASHNPPEYNGIKIFSGNGDKLSVSAEEALEYYMDNVPQSALRGKISKSEGGEEAYITRLISEAEEMGERLGRTGRLDGLKVLVDCGSGAAVMARDVFERLGADVTELCSDCRGECINVSCGALHPERMAEKAERGGFDIGLSFDGDADRIAVWRRRLLGGDEIMLNLTRFIPRGSTVVGTVMTNSALERELSGRGMRFVRTAVGDRSVGEVMNICGGVLGGEPSGHFIIRPSRTGDGLLSGIASSLILLSGELQTVSLDEQKLVGIRADFAALGSAALKTAIEKASRIAGRIVVRKSGTEPVIRIMAEGGDVDGAVEIIINAFEKGRFI